MNAVFPSSESFDRRRCGGGAVSRRRTMAVTSPRRFLSPKLLEFLNTVQKRAGHGFGVARSKSKVRAPIERQARARTRTMTFWKVPLL